MKAAKIAFMSLPMPTPLTFFIDVDTPVFIGCLLLPTSVTNEFVISGLIIHPLTTRRSCITKYTS